MDTNIQWEEWSVVSVESVLLTLLYSPS
jgi:hypothetical protein